MAVAALASAEPAGAPGVSQEAGTSVFQRYQDALKRQQETIKDVSMDVIMEAALPKLKKFGRLNALRHISNFGRITYKVLGFSGDDTVKKEVMARFMTAEVDAALKRKDDMGITPENYNLKYKGEHDRENKRVHVFELKPKKKRVGLFKGELWVDTETFLPVRETGRLVKNPSVFIKKMEFTRDYDIRDGVAWLVHMESKTDTRIVGRAELQISYANFETVQPAADDSAVTDASVVNEAENRLITSEPAPFASSLPEPEQISPVERDFAAGHRCTVDISARVPASTAPEPRIARSR